MFLVVMQKLKVMDVYLLALEFSLLACIIFFFFKQKTAYEMRISDWSSDVCSSDLSTSLRHMAAPPMSMYSLPPGTILMAAGRATSPTQSGVMSQTARSRRPAL